MHDKEIPHRDLKPDNIMVTPKRKIKIVDLGTSKQLEEDEKTRTMCGTPYFLPPEIAKRKKYNKKCDIWSLGITLYFMFLGKYPINAQT